MQLLRDILRATYDRNLKFSFENNVETTKSKRHVNSYQLALRCPSEKKQQPPTKFSSNLSSFSTQHAQRCVPARGVVTQWVCYPKNHVNAFFWKEETHWRHWDLPGTQNRANAFFPVHKSSSATGASEQLLELLLLKELSAAGAFSAASGMGAGPGAPVLGGSAYSKSLFLLALCRWYIFPTKSLDKLIPEYCTNECPISADGYLF